MALTRGLALAGTAAAVVLAASVQPSAGPVVAAGALSAPDAAQAATGAQNGAAAVRVIVIARPGKIAGARAAVTHLGGAVERPLSLVTGFTARLRPAALPALRHEGSVRGVTLDGPVHFASAAPDPDRVASSFLRSSGATEAWRRGNYGAGTTVALVDTGVAMVDDLAGRVIAGPDLSGEDDSRVDRYGHGTVMAGIIAGSGASSRGRYPGVAPRASIVSVKVAGRNGAADVSQVLAALTWVDAYRNALGIDVVNLSWGSVSNQPTAVDPLDYAVERLWAHGLVVVTAAGNDGPGPVSVTKPGDDPAVITVGAYDDGETADPADDVVPTWTSRGPTPDGLSKPDLLAPGSHLVGVASPDSDIYLNNPNAHVGSALIRGSGTSQATAVVSGLAALLRKARPGLSPDQVKGALTGSGDPVIGFGPAAQGAGRVQLEAALAADPSAGPVTQLRATGLGSIEWSRGGRHVRVTCGPPAEPTIVNGEIDALCRPWEPRPWINTVWTPATWTGESWSGESWSGESWSGESWSGESWSGESWSSFEWGG